MSADRCATCRFWDLYDKGSGFYDDVSPDMIGDCRRRAPHVSDELLRRTLPGPSCDQFDRLANDLYVASAYPVTHGDSWCGEFEPIGKDHSPVKCKSNEGMPWPC